MRKVVFRIKRMKRGGERRGRRSAKKSVRTGRRGRSGWTKMGWWGKAARKTGMRAAWPAMVKGKGRVGGSEADKKAVRAQEGRTRADHTHQLFQRKKKRRKIFSRLKIRPGGVLKCSDRLKFL